MRLPCVFVDYRMLLLDLVQSIMAETTTDPNIDTTDTKNKAGGPLCPDVWVAIDLVTKKMREASTS